jgi:hypothetical protein
MSDPVAVPVVKQDSQAESSEPTSSPVDSGFIQDNLQLNHLSYTATKGVPFVINYLGIEEYYKVNEEVTVMARELHELLVDSDNDTLVEQTKKDLDYLSDEMNLGEKDAGVYKLRKLLTIAQIRERQRQLESKKLSVLASLEKVV